MPINILVMTKRTLLKVFFVISTTFALDAVFVVYINTIKTTFDINFYQAFKQHGFT